MNTVLVIIAIYLLAGLPIGIAFVARGVTTIDPAALGSSVRFRLLILPGSVALWPLMLGKWLRGARGSARAVTS